MVSLPLDRAPLQPRITKERPSQAQNRTHTREDDTQRSGARAEEDSHSHWPVTLQTKDRRAIKSKSLF